MVLGLRVGVLTLGHLELLHDLGIDWTGGWTAQDVAVIAFVLTQPAEESRKDLNRFWTGPLLWWLGRRARKVNIEEHADSLSTWITEQSGGPRPIRDLLSKSKGCTAPQHFSLMAAALSRLHLSMAEARALPMKTALQLIYADAESQGQVELWGKETYDKLEACREHVRAMREGRN